jgi:hypothetical protein
MKELLKVTPTGFLVATTTLGFFALLALLFFHNIPEGTKDILQVMLGGVLGQWTTIISYYFGSSSGSARKTDMINDMTGTGNGGTVTTKTTANIAKVTTVTPEPPPVPPVNP